MEPLDMAESADPLILQSPRVQRAFEKIWHLGPRLVAELVIEAAGDNPHLLTLLDRYARLDPAAVRTFGADRFPPSLFEVPK
jgi:hypothetical protein